MTKHFRILSIGLLLSMSLQPTSLIFAQNDERVNISPVEQIEEAIPSEEAEESASLTEEDESPVAEETELFSEVSSEESVDLTNEIDPETPYSLVKAIIAQQGHTTSDVTFFENVSEDVFKESSRAYIRDESVYYLILLDGLTLPEMFMLSVEDGQVARSFMSVDDLMSLAAEALNTNPEAYAGTAIEEFYQVSQESMDDFIGKFIEETDSTTEYQAVLNETVALDNFLLTVTTEWLQHEAVMSTGVVVDDGQVFGLDETTEPIFGEIVAKHAPEYPELEGLLSQFSSGFQGNVALNFELGELGLGLVGEGGGVQYFIRLEEFEVPLPTEEQLFTADEFIERVGFDVISEYRDVRTEAQQEVAE